MAKRERPYIHQTSDMLSKRVKEPNVNDWKILVRMIKYLNETKKKYPNLSANYLKVIQRYLDAGFAVHPDLYSHTKAIMNM